MKVAWPIRDAVIVSETDAAWPDLTTETYG